jgi:DNA-binding CsgD family transcriptional regulator
MSTSELTDRQLSILCLIAAGLTSSAVAAELHISEHTVAQHVGEMFRRFGARSRSELVARAYAAHILAAGVWPPRPARPAETRADEA